MQRWDVISKTQLKNVKKLFNRELAKNEAKEKKEVRRNLCLYDDL